MALIPWKNIELEAYKNMYEQTDVVFMIDADPKQQKTL